MIFASVLASLVLLLAGYAPHVPVEAAQQAHIQVLSESHRIDFPQGITFSLTARSEHRITEVAVYYRLGSESSTVYGYSDFEPGKEVTASFTLETGGDSYVPPGVDVQYRYVVRDAQGHTLETESRQVQYLDPAHDWQTYVGDSLVVLYHDRSLEQVAEAVAVVDARMRQVRDLMDLGEVGPMRAVILNSAAEASQSFPTVSETASDNHVFAGFAFGDRDVFLFRGLDQGGMVHEMTHLMLDEATTSPLARVPSWLNEGLAMYYEAEGGRERTLFTAASQDRLIPLSAMGTVPGKPDDVRLFYAQSQSLVQFMMDTYGHDRMAVLIDALGEGTRLEPALDEAYGMDLAQLEREWQGHLASNLRPPPIVDPGTAVTSSLVALAVVVAVGVLIARWVRGLRSSAVPDYDDEP